MKLWRFLGFVVIMLGGFPSASTVVAQVTPKGTVALIASASGMITAGGSATLDRPGVDELHVETGNKENEATEDLPGAPETRPTRRMHNASLRAFATPVSTLTS